MTDKIYWTGCLPISYLLRIYANDKVSARRIKEENEKKRLEGNRKGADITNGHSVSVQMDGERRSHTFPTHTREQIAKKAGVGIETVVHYNKVVNSNDEDITI